MPKQRLLLLSLALGVLLVVLSGAVVYQRHLNAAKKLSNVGGVSTFKSAADFNAYMQAGTQEIESIKSSNRTAISAFSGAVDSSAVTPQAATNPGTGQPERIISTNDQVAQVDEPDTVKVDASTLYIASDLISYPYPVDFQGGNGSTTIMPKEDSVPSPVATLSAGAGVSSSGPITCTSLDCIKPGSSPIYPPTPTGETKLVTALPLDKLGLASSLDVQGDLLLQGKTLIILGQRSIVAYDIRDTSNPKWLWQYTYGDSSAYQTARLYNGKLYLVTSTGYSFASPCPLEPMFYGKNMVTIACPNIYFPIRQISADVTYTAMSIDIQSGKVGSTSAIVGNSADSTIAMFPDALYIANYSTGKASTIELETLQKLHAQLSDVLNQRINRLAGYQLSEAARQAELNDILTIAQTAGQTAKEAADFNTAYQAALKDVYTSHLRDFDTTIITKFSIPDLTITATGSVPGHLLNQFSLDEYNGTLRTAVSLGQNFWEFAFGSVPSSDVYTLDSNLNELGSVQSLGKGEQIYAVRFVGDRGYVVTFHQTDPLFVLDLSQPNRPTLAGELTLPGFSSYLHPLSNDRILGVGMGPNSTQVQVALFDVSNAAQPKQVSTVGLPGFWSGVANDHHDFLQDPKHKIIVIPADSTIYSISYAGDALSIVYKQDMTDFKRSVVIGDNLYIVESANLSVVDENTWQIVKSSTY